VEKCLFVQERDEICKIGECWEVYSLLLEVKAPIDDDGAAEQVLPSITDIFSTLMLCFEFKQAFFIFLK